MASDKTKKWITTGVVLFIVALIGIYLYDKLFGNALISIQPIISIVIIGIIIYAAILLLRQSGQSALDLDNLIIPIAVIALIVGLIYYKILPSPVSFSIAVQQAFGGVP